MLSLRTTEDWNFSVNLFVPAGGDMETYTNTATSAYEAATAFVAWANNPARVWGGAAYTFTLDWFRDECGVAFGVSIDADDMEVMPDATAQARMHWINDGGTRFAGEGRASGTWWPEGAPGVRDRLGVLQGDGEASEWGALRMGVGGLVLSSPSVEAVAGTRSREVLRSALAVASCPRVGFLYDVSASEWRRVVLGDVRWTPVNVLQSRVSLEVRT